MTTPAIIHLDMDAFYASVEQRDDPRLRGQPVIVGGHARRGVVLAASYEVRPFGVRSAMPMVEALRRAPRAIVVPPRMEAYARASEVVFDILASATPLIEPLSLDEAFLDVTASRALLGSAGDIARRLRARIRDEVGLAASAGIAAVKFVAKMASDLAKPDGQREVTPEETLAFLAPLAVGRLWGVGPHTEETLRRLDLDTIGDLAARPLDWLEAKLGDSGRHLGLLARGIDSRKVMPDRLARSIGSEDTFEADLAAAHLLPHLHAQALRVAHRLRLAGLRTRVVQLKLKLALRGAGRRYPLLTRRLTLEEATDDGQAIYRAACALLERESLPGPVRLTGVSAQEVVSAGAQLGLFAPPPSRAGRLNQALDRIIDKFGSRAVTTGDLVGERNNLVRAPAPPPGKGRGPR